MVIAYTIQGLRFGGGLSAAGIGGVALILRFALPLVIASLWRWSVCADLLDILLYSAPVSGVLCHLRCAGMTIRAVIFDYGHTLVDFVYAEDRLLEVYTQVHEMLTAQAIRDLPQAPELVRELSRRVERTVTESYMLRQLEEVDIVQAFAGVLRGFGVELSDQYVRQIVELEHRALTSTQRMDPANLDVLRRLKSAGLKIGLVSNAHFLPEMMREDAARMGIDDYLDASLYSAEIGVRKPHRAMFEGMLEKLGVQPEEGFRGRSALRRRDGGAGRGDARGTDSPVSPGGVEGHPIVPDRVIESLSELPGYLEELQQAR
jgi:FMN phosphatase YigB (HAD superfamily)